VNLYKNKFILFADFLSYKIVCINTLKYFDDEMKLNVKLPSFFENRFRFYDETSFNWMKRNINNGIFRPIAGKNIKRPAIWLFGCSFAYGNSIADGEH